MVGFKRILALSISFILSCTAWADGNEPYIFILGVTQDTGYPQTGHYTGLMHLGHEAMGASAVPVYAMPRMNDYLKTNGPWSQLVNYRNIRPHTVRCVLKVNLLVIRSFPRPDVDRRRY